MMTRTAAAVVAMLGCGRAGFDAVPRDGDTGGSGYRELVLADDPLAYWRFDDPGATARDERGAFAGAYAGTCGRAPGAIAQDPSQSLASDGASCMITVGAGLAFLGRAPFSIEVWVRPDVADTFQIYFMKQSRAGGNPEHGYALLTSPMGVYLERYANQDGEVTQYTPIAAGAFLHLVGTYDGNDLRMYINGQPGPPKPHAVDIPDYTAPAMIGSFPAGANWTVGDLDELAIYDHALAPDRVLAHYNFAVDP